MVFSSVPAKRTRPLIVCGILLGALSGTFGTHCAMAQAVFTAGDAAATTLEKLKAIPQVEVEAQFVQISPDDAKSVGLVPTAKLDAPSVGFVSREAQSKLIDLLNQDKAKIMTAPRVRARSHVFASIGQSRMGPTVVLSKLGTDGKALPLFKPRPEAPTYPADGILSLNTESVFGVTPTVNNDETITLLLDLSSSLRLLGLHDERRDGTTITNGEGIKATAEVKDGDAIAIYGLTPRFFDMSKDEETPAPNMVVLVIPHVMRSVANGHQ